MMRLPFWLDKVWIRLDGKTKWVTDMVEVGVNPHMLNNVIENFAVHTIPDHTNTITPSFVHL